MLIKCLKQVQLRVFFNLYTQVVQLLDRSVASYNLQLRNIKAYIPEYPVGTAAECADMIHDFLPIARTVIGLSDLKIISFGPRPLNFLACNAPIKQLYNLGLEIEENSVLDLFEAFNKHAGDPRIARRVSEISGPKFPR